MYIVFVGRLVCYVNVLYMELSYTGLDRSTRASEHVIVQISYACKTTSGFINCFPIIDVYLTKLHWNVYILSTVGVVLVGRLVCSVNIKVSL